MGSYSSDLLLKLAVTILTFGGVCWGIVSVQEYCNKFDNYSVKPLICLLRVNTTTPIPPWTDEDEDDCSCDVNCFPDSEINIDPELPDNMSRNLLPSDLQCQPCGTNCPINVFLTPRCSCAAIGPSTSINGPRCRCSVTCANTRQAEDPFCIFNVTQIRRIRDTSRVYSCECDKSRAAQNNPYPDFACLCQPNL